MSPDDRGVQPPRVVLVTGASRFPGGFLVSRLVQDPSIERVVAVDAVSPSKDMMRRMGRAEFVRADIRNSLIGKVIRGAEVDTVVHAATVAQAPRSGSRAAMKDMNVIGAMQLFAVCQKSPSVRKVVLRSASAVYGGSPGDPAKFTEEMGARRPPRGAGPATASTSRATRGRWADVVRTSRSPSCGSRRSWARTGTDGWRDTCLPRSCRESSAATPACSCCTRRTRWRRCTAPRSPGPPARSTSPVTGSS